METESYRERAQEFLEAYVAERNDFYAGLKDSLDLEPIFDSHAELFSEDSIGALFAAHEAAPPKRRRRDQYLLSFAVGHALSRHVAEEDQAISAILKETTEDVDGEALGYHDAAVELSQEADRDRRSRLVAARAAIQARANDLRLRRLEKLHTMARELSGMPYLECMQFLSGANFLVLKKQLEAFLAASRERYLRDLDLLAARYLDGTRREDLALHDIRYLLRGVTWEEHFPADRLLSTLKRTLMGLGIDLKKQEHIRIDAEERKGKNADAACFGIRVPDRIYLVLRPHGGLKDYLSLLEKTGQALYLGHISETQPFEFRYLGDGAVSQTFGTLFQGLCHNPEWLEDLLGLAESRELVEFLRFRKLHWLRLYAARFLYEMELHGEYAEAPSSEALTEAYVGHHQETLGVPGVAADFLSSVEDPFYGTAFLRAWIFEAELRQTVEERFGTRWYTRPAAGGFLKDLWSYGTRYRVEELREHIRYMDLDLEPIKRDLTR